MRRASCLACLALAWLAVSALAESVADKRLGGYPWTEPVVSKGQLIPSGQPMYLQSLPDTNDAIIHLGAIMADAGGTCSLTAYGDMASGAKELGSVRATGHAEVSRVLGDPLETLRLASLDGAWFAVTCDTPAYAYADVLASDESHVYFVEPSGPSKEEVVDSYVPNFTNEDYVPNFTNEEIDMIPATRNIWEILEQAPLQAAPSAPPAPDGSPPPRSEADGR